MKIKAVTESPDLPAEVRKPPTLPTDSAVLNVHARLCKSNQVTEALAVVLTDVQRALGIKVSSEDLVKKRRVRAKDYQASAVSDKQESAPHKGATRRQSSDRHPRDRAEDRSDAGDLSGENDSDAGMEAYNDRLASSNEDDSGEDDDSDVDAMERRLKQEGVARGSTGTMSGAYDHAADLSLSEEDTASAASSPEPQKARPAAPKKSSFLPSLSMGGYISGSGSDIDDVFDAAPKKNRPGQRARQQIWEKKFGARAKHLQKQERNEGWDAKRGATGDVSERRSKDQRHAAHVARDSGKPFLKTPNAGGAKSSQTAKVKHKDDSGPIHPSWEAAKKAKEQKQATAAFQGKKITFD